MDNSTNTNSESSEHSVLTDPRWQDSKWRRVIEAMGFQFAKFVISTADGIREIRGIVHCQCGRNESFSLVTTEIENIQLSQMGLDDPFKLLFESGAFTPDHLREDGFPDEVIAQAEKAWMDFREENFQPLKYVCFTLVKTMTCARCQSKDIRDVGIRLHACNKCGALLSS